MIIRRTLKLTNKIYQSSCPAWSLRRSIVLCLLTKASVKTTIVLSSFQSHRKTSTHLPRKYLCIAGLSFELAEKTAPARRFFCV